MIILEQSYFVPAHDSTTEFVEKKSRFITYLAHVTSEKEATEFIDSIRARHSDATHNCIAYRIREPRIERFSDDGEPSGTAGMPMLEVLKKEDIYDVCVVVTRYFGGILLGAGGLVRAYAKGAADGIASAGKAVREQGVRFTASFSYSGYDRVLKLLEGYSHNVNDTVFGEAVTLDITVKLTDFDVICSKLRDMFSGNAEISEISRDFDSFK